MNNIRSGPYTQIKTGTAAEWASENPVLDEGEPGFISDTFETVVGDGETPFLDLNQPISALDQRFVQLPDSHTDGRILAWSGTLGEYVEVAPVGQSEIASAVNITGTPTTVSATSGPGVQVIIVGSTISVPASSRPVTLFYEVGFAQTVVGTGSAIVSLYETTGAATQLDYTPGTLPNATSTGLREVNLSRSYRLGATVATRTFELRAWIYQVSGSPAGSILNSALRQTSLRAVAG